MTTWMRIDLYIVSLLFLVLDVKGERSSFMLYLSMRHVILFVICGM